MKKIFFGLLILVINSSLKSMQGPDSSGEDLKYKQESIDGKLKFSQDLYKKCIENTFKFRNGNAPYYFIAEQNKRADFCRMFVKLALKEEFKKK